MRLDTPSAATNHLRLRPVADRRPPELSVVIPVWDEEAVVPELVARVLAVLDAIGRSAEVLLVDDGSSDGTWAEIERAHRNDPRISGLSLSRNFGHQAAIAAGLAESRGRAVVVMDGDLQDPPEAIPDLIARLDEGAEVAYAIRASRPESWPLRLAYAAFYRGLSRFVATPIPLDAGDFGAMSRRVVDLIVAQPEQGRFIRGLRAWIGFRQIGVPIDREPRHAGRPKYTLGKLVSLALDGLIGYGEGPLRPVGLLGLILAGCGLIGLSAALIRWVTWGSMAPGWAWVMMVGLGIGGVQLFATAILGEYAGRILRQVSGRPAYVARHRLGGPERSSRSMTRPPARIDRSA